MARPKSDRDKRTLRLPRPLAAQLQSAAAENGCSVNAEIIRRLNATFNAYRR